MIKPKVQIKGDFKATERLRAAVKRIDGSHFTLGVHGDAGSYLAEDGQSDPPSVGEVAWWIEKGTKYMPSRPFLYPAINDNIELVRAKMALALSGMAFKKWTVEKGLTLVANFCLILLQNKVKSNVGPALSGSWDPPRGYLGYKHRQGMGMRTLIATGLLYRSLAYKIFLSDGAQIEANNAAPKEAPGAQQASKDHEKARAGARTDAKAIKARAKAQKQAFSASHAAPKGPSAPHGNNAHKATNLPAKKTKGH